MHTQQHQHTPDYYAHFRSQVERTQEEMEVHHLAKKHKIPIVEVDKIWKNFKICDVNSDNEMEKSEFIKFLKRSTQVW